jgi:hypothetical protein
MARPSVNPGECVMKIKDMSLAERKERKRLYDIEYRRKNAAKIKALKAERFQRDYYDPNNPLAKKMAAYHKKRQPKHNEYCRQPEYKAKKHKYDRERYAKDKFGPLWEVHVLAMNITEEAQNQMTKFEMMQSKGTINKAQNRKREYAKTQRS